MAIDRDRILKPVKKLRKLIGKLDARPAPESVHDLRTNARRFEAMFEALSLDANGLNKSMLKDLGRLRKHAGKVRDMDVLTSFASTIRLPTPDTSRGERECAVQLLEHLGAERKKYAAKLDSETRRLGPSLRRDLKHASSVMARLLPPTGSAPNGRTAAADATAAAAKCAAQLASPRRLGRNNLHPYRLQVKELRNLLQMAGEAPGLEFV
jgi:CHAD domain-containing protein